MYGICVKSVNTKELFSQRTVSLKILFLNYTCFVSLFDSMKFTKMEENAIKHLDLAIQNTDF